jgi:hypothetical protein
MTNEAQKPGQPYVIGPDGKKHYTRATIVDVVVSVLLPLVGVLIGAVAMARGQRKRGGTMIAGGVVAMALSVVILRVV